MYAILDSCGEWLRGKFKTWTEADNFRQTQGRKDWRIIEY
jgi:hypothetical protein